MSDRVCITGREVRDFIDNYKFTRRNLKKNSDLFSTIKRDIRDKIKIYADAEQKFYRDFNLNGGLPEFQKRFDAILQGNLTKFSSVYLQKSNLFTQTFKPITNDQIAQWVEDYIKKEIYKEASNPKKRLTKAMLNKITERITTEINNSRKTNAKDYSTDMGEVRSFNLKGRIKDLLKGKSTNLGEYKKDFKVLMQHSDTSYSNSTFEMDYEATFSIDDNSDIEETFTPLDELSYYPYFGLTETQKKIATNIKSGQGQRVWENFKDHIKSFLAGEISGSTIDKVMNQLGPSAFFQSSLSGVTGILGELQMLFVTARLMGEQKVNVNMIASGPLRNLQRNSAELGADILLNETLGIQVKNYKGNWSGDKPVNYWLKNELSFSTFQERVKGNADLVDFDKYVAILNYNQPNWARQKPGAKSLGFSKESYDRYNSYYNKKIAKKSGVMNSMTKLLVAENMDQFLSLQESYEILTGNIDNQIKVSNSYINAFYVFGGANIIPVRTIFQLLLKRVEELEKAINWKQSAETDNFYVKYNYQGTIWPDGVNKDSEGNYSSSKSIQSVLDELKIELKMNIWLSDLNLAAYSTKF